MGNIDRVVELLLMLLLGATLFQAVRLQRTLTRLRQDRSALDASIAEFDSGTRQAEAGLSSVREAAESLSRQLSHAAALRDDLAFLADRGEGAADRLDQLVRAARELEPPRSASGYSPVEFQAETAPETQAQDAGPVVPKLSGSGLLAQASRLRSAAERNLLSAMQGRS